MRTTLDIADDVLFAAKDVARIERKPLGQVISELARQLESSLSSQLHETPRLLARLAAYAAAARRAVLSGVGAQP